MKRREMFGLVAASAAAAVGVTDFAEAAPIKRSGTTWLATFPKPITAMTVFRDKIVVITDNQVHIIDPQP